MKIAIIGAPGSGKTELAEALGPKLGGTWALVDDYAEFACDKVDFVPGLNGGYIANLAVAIERIGLERTPPGSDSEHTITCGSLLETSVYVAMDMESAVQHQTEDERLINTRRLEATLKTLACLYSDSFEYDHVFYLRPKSEEWEYFDKNLQTSFAAFFLVPALPLLEDTVDENVEVALKFIKKEITVDEYLGRDTSTAA